MRETQSANFVLQSWNDILKCSLCLANGRSVLHLEAVWTGESVPRGNPLSRLLITARQHVANSGFSPKPDVLTHESPLSFPIIKGVCIFSRVERIAPECCFQQKDRKPVDASHNDAHEHV